MSDHEEHYEEGRREAAEDQCRRRARRYNSRLRRQVGQLEEPPVFMCEDCGYIPVDGSCACKVGGTAP